jgi:3'-5' exoribonuclease
MIAGALFHDMGKMDEFELKSSIKMTTEGMLVGHVSIAVQKLSKAMDEIKTPEILKIKIIHMILTHMGDYGSNKKPSFPEALAVYYADQMDADLMRMILLKEEAKTEDDYIYHKELGNIYLK